MPTPKGPKAKRTAKGAIDQPTSEAPAPKDASTDPETIEPPKASKPRKPHPRARPLPADPIERQRMLARREIVKNAVAKWRRRHPRKARALFAHCERIQALRRAASAYRLAIAA